jgi:hypothetical protein
LFHPASSESVRPCGHDAFKPDAPRRPPTVVANKIFRGSRAVDCGWLSRAQLRSRAWQRLFHDIYADARMQRTHKLRCRAAQAFLPSQDALIAGRSAAHLLGVSYVEVDDPVEVLTPHPFGPIKGMKVHVGAVSPGDRWRHGQWTIARRWSHFGESVGLGRLGAAVSGKVREETIVDGEARGG